MNEGEAMEFVCTGIGKEVVMRRMVYIEAGVHSAWWLTLAYSSTECSPGFSIRPFKREDISLTRRMNSGRVQPKPDQPLMIARIGEVSKSINCHGI